MGFKSIPKDAKKNLNWVEDYLQTVHEAFLIEAFRSHFALDTFDSDPRGFPDPNDSQEMKSNWLKRDVGKFIDTFISYTFAEKEAAVGE